MRIEKRENTTAGSDVGPHEVRGMPGEARHSVLPAAGWWLATPAVATQANRRTLWLSRELVFVFGGSRVKVTSQKPAIRADFTWFYSVPRGKYRDSTSLSTVVLSTPFQIYLPSCHCMLRDMAWATDSVIEQTTNSSVDVFVLRATSWRAGGREWSAY
jgi:hypothetical protein